MIRVVFLGPPGAGKGTQAHALEERYGVRQISTGDILRTEVGKKSPLGLHAKEFMDRGELVPDAVIIGMIGQFIEDVPGFIFDGFPRTMQQADDLDRMLAGRSEPLTAVLLFKADRPELVKRLTGRWTNPRTGRVYHEFYDPPKKPGIDDEDGQPLVQRPDDKAETVNKRLDVYEAQTAPLVDYYRKTGLLVPIDAMQPVEAVTQRIVDALGSANIAR